MKKIEISKKDLKNNIKIIKDIVIGEEKDDKGNKTQIIVEVHTELHPIAIMTISSIATIKRVTKARRIVEVHTERCIVRPVLVRLNLWKVGVNKTDDRRFNVRPHSDLLS